MPAKKNIAVLPGDGIGPEVIEESIKVLKAIEERFGHNFELKYAEVGASAIDKTGDPFPKDTEEICRNSDAILFGAIGDPKYDNDPTAKVRPEQGLLRMRKVLGLYANIRPVKTYDSLLEKSPLKEEIIKDVDFVVFRELTGGIYFGEPSYVEKDFSYAVDSSTYSKEEIERIVVKAFKAAQSRSKVLTLVDKANVLSTSKLWRKIAKDISTDYPDVEVNYLFVDNAAMQLILNPSQFDVVVTENMFGDIITDEASVLSGSIGLMPSASVGDQSSLFEPIHGSFPEGAGKGIANPMACILSLAMLLDYAFDLQEESKLIESVVEQAIEEKFVTPDLDSNSIYSTSDIGNYISNQIQSVSSPIEQ